MSTNYTSNIQFIKLLNGYFAESDFYEKVRLAAAAGVQKARPEVLYTARSLCGEAFWFELETRKQRLLAGRCLSHMVATKLFNLQRLKYKRSSTWRYRLK